MKNASSPQPLQTVMIRRGERIVKGIPTRLLIPRIREKRLRPSDEISGDGKRWIRLDQHHQLARWFENSSPDELEAPVSFPLDELPATATWPDNEGSESTVFVQDSADETPYPAPPPLAMDGQLEELAQMLKELNE